MNDFHVATTLAAARERLAHSSSGNDGRKAALMQRMENENRKEKKKKSDAKYDLQQLVHEIDVGFEMLKFVHKNVQHFCQDVLVSRFS